MTRGKTAARPDWAPPRARHFTRLGLFLALAALFSLTVSPFVAALDETVSSDLSRTVTMDANTYDAYHISGGRVGTVEITADGFVDFYVMDGTGYQEYTDPNSISFHTIASDQNAKSFTYSTPVSGGRIIVIDNENWTTGGASGATSVTYAIAVSFGTTSQPGPTPLSITLAVVAGGAVFGSIAAVVLRQRKKRHAVQTTIPVAPQQFLPPPPPPGAPLPPPPGFQPEFMPAPVATVQQTAGKIERRFTPAEYGVLVQDFKKHKGKLLILPILGLGLSLVLRSLQDWTMAPLVLFSVLSPIAVVVLRKYRSSIASGNVIEYQGVPTAISTETHGKKQLYRVLFGTESMLISPSLYGRFVQNQVNALAVFEKVKGQVVAISVNGTPLSAPLNEPVVRVGLPTSSARSGETMNVWGAK